MSLKSVEASLTEGEITEFNEILAAYAAISPEYNQRMQALSEDKKAKFVEWKKAQDQESLLKHQSDPVMLTAFKKATQPDEATLRELAAAGNTETADNSAAPAKPKKKKGCTLL